MDPGSGCKKGSTEEEEGPCHTSSEKWINDLHDIIIHLMEGKLMPFTVAFDLTSTISSMMLSCSAVGLNAALLFFVRYSQGAQDIKPSVY